MSESLTWADIGLGDLDISEVEAAEGFEDTIGPGVFMCITGDMVLGEDEKSGAVYARMEYEIAQGEHAGKNFSETFWDLGNPEAWSRRFLKTRLKDLGLPDDFKGMPEPGQLKGIPVVVTRKERRGKGDKSDQVYLNVTGVKIYNAGEQAKEEPKEEKADPAFGSFFG